MAFKQFNKQNNYQPMSEINITPFVDVMLVLLIIFMITAPMLYQQIDINLPTSQAKEIKQKHQPLTLMINKKGKIFLADSEIPPNKLYQVLKNNIKLQKQKEIYLHADKSLSYGFIIDIMAKMNKAGAQHIAMVTDPSKK